MSVQRSSLKAARPAGGLTYCSNIHPGEHWSDVMANLDAYVPAVKQAISPNSAFPLGLRISSVALDEITDGDINGFHRWCDKHDCYLLTVNGFPYGNFHGQVVKDNVYRPDWCTQERVNYTLRLAELCVRLAHSPADISISTVPIAFKDDFAHAALPTVRSHLIQVLEHLAHLESRKGVTVRLALEPEPGCVLETINDVVWFFDQLGLPAALKRFLGICLDACHQAVEFEQPAEIIEQLHNADIPIMKVQVSSALRATGDQVPNLLRFDEPTYLHQAVALESHDDGPRIFRFNDFPDLASYLQTGATPQECRVHFHVPIFAEHVGECGTTRFFLEDLLPRLDPRIPLEVETYSFGVLPSHLREQGTGACIVRELTWAATAKKKRVSEKPYA